MAAGLEGIYGFRFAAADLNTFFYWVVLFCRASALINKEMTIQKLPLKMNL